MDTKSTILKELMEISPAVAGIGSALPYQVPQGYFEGLAETILQRVKAESLNARDELETLSPLLNGLSRKLPFEVPQGYFNELTENVVGGVKAIDYVQDELQELSPLMQDIRHKNVYQLPQGYFDNLAGNILAEIKQQQPAKVISLNARTSNARRFMRFAAAAVITGVLAIAGWFYFNNDTVSEPISASLGKISDDNKVTDEEMSSFLENETFPSVVSASAGSEDMDASDVREMLADLSEDELQQFLITL